MTQQADQSSLTSEFPQARMCRGALRATLVAALLCSCVSTMLWQVLGRRSVHDWGGGGVVTVPVQVLTIFFATFLAGSFFNQVQLFVNNPASIVRILGAARRRRPPSSCPTSSCWASPPSPSSSCVFHVSTFRGKPLTYHTETAASCASQDESGQVQVCCSRCSCPVTSNDAGVRHH